MTLVALAGAALLCLAGIRAAAAAAFVVAAVVAALGPPGPSSLAAVWGAATCAGLLFAGVPVRRLALGAIGLGATLVAASAPNAAAVLPAWTVGAACAVLPAARAHAERRWATAVVAADIPLAAGVCWLVLRDGYTAWPPRGAAGCALLALAAAARVPLAAGTTRGGRGSVEAGLVLLRSQAVVLLSMAISGSREVALVSAAAGPAAFAAGGLASRDSARDALQEAGLVTAALAGARLGWGPSGWAWGALAAATLCHLARIAEQPRSHWARTLRDVARGGGIGSPLLPVVAAVGYAAVGGSGVWGAFTVVALLTGLSLRAGRPVDGGRRAPGTITQASAAGFAGLGIALGLWAALATVPGRLAGRPVPWPGTWVVLVVVAGALAGARFAWLTAPQRSRTPPPVVPTVSVRGGIPAVAERVPVAVLLVALGAVGAGVWVAGLVRGFL